MNGGKGAQIQLIKFQAMQCVQMGPWPEYELFHIIVETFTYQSLKAVGQE